MDELLSHDPLVSIVLPTYNCDRFLTTSIDSCLQQTYQNIELIVIDGGSKDNTLSIVNGYQDPRIKLYHQPSNTGRLPGALNIGFSHAAGVFLTWAQGDDFYKENAIQEMVSYLIKNPDIGLVYAGMWFIDGEDNILGESNIQPPEALVTTNPVQHCFLYRREVAEKVGDYDVNFLMVEDAEYWMRVSKLFKLAVIADRFYYHRFHDDSLTIKNYGGHLAQRLLADASKKHFGSSWSKYQHRIAKVFIEEAFAAYQKKDYKHVLPCILYGTLRDPLWLTEKGVLSIGLQSLAKIVQRA
jgi:glycosyltransferase involved in cell wall biosynthesis